MAKIIDLATQKEGNPDNTVKYSDLLTQLMTPFEKELEKLDDLYTICQFSVHAWNYAILQSLLPLNEAKMIIKQTIAELEEDSEGVDEKLMLKMIDFKNKNFKEYENFITDFEIDFEDASGEPVLHVVSQVKEAFLLDSLNILAENLEIEDENENYVDRAAISVKPKQPYKDWVDKLYPEDENEEIMEGICFLVNSDYTSTESLQKWLKKNFDKIFTHQLYEIHTNKKEWPQRRNLKMFNEWFEVQLSTFVYDLEKDIER